VAIVFGPGTRWVLSLLRWWGPLLAYMGLIFFLSSRPQPGLLREVPDYLLHFVAYFFLAVLAVRAFARGWMRPVKRSAVFLGLALSFVYASSDEWHQSFVPGREASGWDLLADGLGILAAWGSLLVFWYLMRSVERSSRAVFDTSDR
jgi:VanZ family protein